MPLLTSFLSFPCLTVLEGPLSWLGQETVSTQVSGVLFPEQKAVEKTELVGGIYKPDGTWVVTGLGWAYPLIL